jgi:hypothetical protein
MPPTHHDPDHTAHIRHQLAQLAITGAIGLVIATWAVAPSCWSTPSPVRCRQQ